MIGAELGDRGWRPPGCGRAHPPAARCWSGGGRSWPRRSGLVDAAARGHGGALLVTGEAGVGKSRLVDELRGRAAAAGMTVLVGRSVDGGGTYRAVTEALARLLRTRAAPRRPRAAALPRGAAQAAARRARTAEPLAAARPTPRSCSARACSPCWPGSARCSCWRTCTGPTRTPSTSCATSRARWSTRRCCWWRRPATTSRRPGLARLAADVRTLAVAPPGRRGRGRAGGGLPRSARCPRPSGRSWSPAPTGCRCWSRSCWPSVRRGCRRRWRGSWRGGWPPCRRRRSRWCSPPRWSTTPTGGCWPRSPTRPEVVTGRPTRSRGRCSRRCGRRRTSGCSSSPTGGCASATPSPATPCSPPCCRRSARRWPPGPPACSTGAATARSPPGSTASPATRPAGRRSSSSWPARTSGRGAVRSAAAFLDEAGEHAAPAERVHVLTLLGRAVEALETGEPALDRLRGAERAELCLRLARAAIVAGRWADARRHVETPVAPTTPAPWCSSPTPPTARATSRRPSASPAPPPRPPATPRCSARRCRAGPQHVHRRSRGVRRGAAARRAGRRRARPAALAGAGAVRAGQPRAHPRRPGRALPRRRAGAGAGGGHARRRRAGGPAAGQRAYCSSTAPSPPCPLLRGAAEQAGRLRLTGLQAMAELFAAIDAGLAGDEAAMTAWLAAAQTRPDAPTEVTALGPMVHALPHLLRHCLGDGVRAARRGRARAPRARLGHPDRPHRAVGAAADGGRRPRPRRPRAPSEATRSSRRSATRPRWATPTRSPRAGPDAPTDAAAHFAAADAALAHLPWWNRLLAAVRAGRRGRRRLGRPGARPARRPRRARGRGRGEPGPHLPRPAAHGGRADPLASGRGGTRRCAPGASPRGRPRCSRSSPPG